MFIFPNIFLVSKVWFCHGSSVNTVGSVLTGWQIQWVFWRVTRRVLWTKHLHIQLVPTTEDAAYTASLNNPKFTHRTDSVMQFWQYCHVRTKSVGLAEFTLLHNLHSNEWHPKYVADGPIFWGGGWGFHYTFTLHVSEIGISKIKRTSDNSKENIICNNQTLSHTYVPRFLLKNQ